MKKTVLLLFILLFSFNFLADAKSSGEITVKITNINSTKGTVRVALYKDVQKFEHRHRPYKWKNIKPDDSDMTITFQDVDFGSYAIAVFHDVNGNGKLDKNFINIPTEPYGFSTNFRPITNDPKFDDIVFHFNKDNMVVRIKLHK